MRDSSPLPIIVLLAALAGCGASQTGTSAVVAGVETPAVAGIAAPAVAESEAPAAAAPLVETQLMDEQGFGQPMIAARAQLPGDWQTRGGIGWDRRSECVSNHLRVNWLAVSPDGRRALELMPGLSWQLQGTDIPMNPCPPLAIRDTRQFLQSVAQRYPGVRVLRYRDRPDLAPAPQASNGARVQNTAGELLIAYHDGSVEVRELLTAMLSTSELQGNVCISSPLVYAYRVAGGEPDADFSDRFMKSLHPDPQWQAQVQRTSSQLIAQISARQRQEIATWHTGQMARINARGAADRAQIRMQTNREVAQIYSNVWSNSQATDERIQRRTLEGIGEYNTYADPASGGVVRESTDYNRVLRGEDGGYISTNDPYLQPAGSEELQRVP
ncbi:MAG: hypothetical protein WDO72_08265 [Pseudomonadota bacterium]